MIRVARRNHRRGGVCVRECLVPSCFLHHLSNHDIGVHLVKDAVLCFVPGVGNTHLVHRDVIHDLSRLGACTHRTKPALSASPLLAVVGVVGRDRNTHRVPLILVSLQNLNSRHVRRRYSVLNLWSGLQRRVFASLSRMPVQRRVLASENGVFGGVGGFERCQLSLFRACILRRMHGFQAQHQWRHEVS